MASEPSDDECDTDTLSSSSFSANDLIDTAGSTNGYEASRKEELDALRSIYEEDNIKFREWGTRLGFRITFGKMKLEIVTDENYPDKRPIHINVTGLSVPQCIEITSALMTLAEQKCGSYQLYDLVEEARSLLPAADPKAFQRLKFEFSSVAYDALPNAQVAAEYMGKITLEMITEYLKASKYTVLHSEIVLNPRLQARFENMWDHLTVKYKDWKKLKEKFLTPEIVFHGTRRDYIANIVARGFVKPGDSMNGGKSTLKVQCGSRYGIGIYSSPDPLTSVSYADDSDEGFQKLPGEKLLVCACLMGRRYTCPAWTRDGSDQVMDGFDSHVGESFTPKGEPKEYVVFNHAQLLPLYVLHIDHEDCWNDRGPSKPRFSSWSAYQAWWNDQQRQKLTGLEEVDESYQTLTPAMKKKILTKIARKHFPMGFGPATGNNFVVEEIAPVDDDEEDWGEYQMDRKGYLRIGTGTAYKAENGEEEEKDGGNHLDEYQKARCVEYLYKN